MELWEFISSNSFEITSLIALVGFAFRLSNKINAYIAKVNSSIDNINSTMRDQDNKLEIMINDLREDLNRDRDNLDKKITEMESKRVASLDRTRIIMNGVEATLRSLHDDGHNGPVTKSLEEIEEYKSQKSVY